MNRDHLLDHGDFIKGQLLGASGLSGTGRLRVVGMFTDAPWAGTPELAAYADMLGVEAVDVLTRPVPRGRDPALWDPWFGEVKEACSGADVFLDPDTGVHAASGLGFNIDPAKGCKYLRPSEILDLLDEHKVIAVHQASHRKAAGWLSEHVHGQFKRELARRVPAHVHMCGYECSHVSMAFFALDPKRIAKVRAGLCAMSPRWTNPRVV